jgi:hypothetical protein
MRMDDEQNAGSRTASLRRPAADPVTAGRAFGPLTAPRAGERLTTTVSAAVTGMVAAVVVAIAVAMPWAVGVLIFQGPERWQSSLARWALLLAAAAVLLGASFVWFARFRSNGAPAVGAGNQAGRHLTEADLDAQDSALLRRAQDAIDAVRSAEVCRAGLLDAAAYRTALAAHEWEIATALRQQSELRQARARLPAIAEDSAAAELLDRQHEAAHLAEQSIAGRVTALEQLAAEVRGADKAHRDWLALVAVSELADRHLDMLARTAADSHAIAEIAAMSQHARSVHIALRGLPAR